METKNTDDKVLKELEDLSFDHHFLVSPHSPGGGGLALMWTNEVSISILSSSHNFIDTSVTYKDTSFNATFTYGEPDVSKRQLVWDQLSLLGAGRTGPWMLTGDFNEILENNEKSEGRVHPESFSRKMISLI